MAQKVNLKMSAEEILERAKECDAEQSYLFITTFKRYQVLLHMLSELEKEIMNGQPTITKEYVKGRHNVVINPVFREYNNTATTANQTATALIKIIDALNDTGLNGGASSEL